MTKTILTTLVAAAITFTSCTTTTTSFRKKSSDYLDIQKGSIQQVSKIADYRVDTKKVKGTNTGMYNTLSASSSTLLAKELAIGDAISKAKCDFLVNPLFDITVNGASIAVTVEGYPAHYTTFETVKYVPTKTVKTPPRSIPRHTNPLIKKP